MKPTEKLQLLELPPEAGYKMNLGAKLCTIKKKSCHFELVGALRIFGTCMDRI